MNPSEFNICKHDSYRISSAWFSQNIRLVEISDRILPKYDEIHRHKWREEYIKINGKFKIESN
jgi:hypothetical protein